MRVLAIGLGGSGSRIVDSLYEHDRKSGVGCMQPIAIDTDANTLMALRNIPVSARLHFAPLDLAQSSDICQTIHSGEIMSYIQGADTVRIDALLLCCGLGGCMGAAVAAIVPELRKSFIEPIFMVVTLPCRMEGEKRSAQAADDLDLMLKIVDGIILFDNETWYRKIKDQLLAQQEKEGVRKDTGPQVMFDLLNIQVARRVGLLLRAGEINEKSYEPAEVVLDAGEVLNTLRGMGLVAIGYASEEIPSSFLGFLNRMQLNRYFMESSQKKAARIVA
ncbi:MAG: cell division protein, partial [Methanomicrobiales archaeon]|nr:cell division protein [Methanomicrobiales archaeon]